MRRSLGWLLPVVIGLCPALAWAGPRQPTHVACVGDSITAGVGASAGDKSYPALLQGMLGAAVQVKNFGHSGATMLSAGYGDLPYQAQGEFQAATDFVSGAGDGAVVDVIIMLGANDSKPFNWAPDGKPKNDQQYLKDYTAMVEHFRALPTAPAVYLALPLATGDSACCSIRGAVIHDEQIPLIQGLAQDRGLPVIDVNTPTSGHPEYFVDGVHPNDAGYAVVAQVMHDGLLRVPSVSITQPAPDTIVYAGSTVSLLSTVGPDTVPVARVEFFAGETSLGVATSAPFGLTWTPPSVSVQALTARATDTTGASATSDPVNLIVTVEQPSFGGAAGSAGGPGQGEGGAGSSGGSGQGGAGAGGAGAAGKAGQAGQAGQAGAGQAGAGQGGKAGQGGAKGGAAGLSGSSGQEEATSGSDDGGCQAAAPGGPGAGGGVAALVMLAWAVGRRRRR